MTPLTLMLWCLAVLAGAFTVAVVLAAAFILLGLLIQAVRRPSTGWEVPQFRAGKPPRIRFRETPPQAPRLIARFRHGRPQ